MVIEVRLVLSSMVWGILVSENRQLQDVGRIDFYKVCIVIELIVGTAHVIVSAKCSRCIQIQSIGHDNVQDMVLRQLIPTMPPNKKPTLSQSNEQVALMRRAWGSTKLHSGGYVHST